MPAPTFSDVVHLTDGHPVLAKFRLLRDTHRLDSGGAMVSYVLILLGAFTVAVGASCT